MNAQPGNTVGRIQEYVGKTMVGIAGAAGAATLGALAYYAYQKTGVQPSLIVDPDQLRELTSTGAAHVDSVVRGMGSVTKVVTDVAGYHDGTATVRHLYEELAHRGADIDVFKQAITDYAKATSGSTHDAVALKLLNPDTPLTASVQSKIVSAIWHNDKHAALSQQTIESTLEYARNTFLVTGASLAAAAGVDTEQARRGLKTLKDALPTMDLDGVKRSAKFIADAARRAAVDLGLMSPAQSKEINTAIESASFSPEEARARVAAEYAERQSPHYRAYTLTWLAAADNEDRKAMLQLFGLERQALGQHTAVGRAVMIDNFNSVELRALAKNEAEFAKPLLEMADRREALERKGHRPVPVLSATVDEQIQVLRISDLVAERVEQTKGRRAATMA